MNKQLWHRPGLYSALFAVVLIAAGCDKEGGDKQRCGDGSGYPIEFCSQVDHYESGYGVPGQDWITVTCLVGPENASVSNQMNGTYYCSGTYKLSTFDHAIIDMGWGGTVETGTPTESCTISKGEGTFQVSITKLNGGTGNIFLMMSSGSMWMFSTAIVNVNCNYLPAPSNLRALYKPLLNQVRLTWNDNSSTETGFEVQRSEVESSGYEKIGEVAANTAEYADTGIDTAKIYYYRVRARKNEIYSNPSTSVSVNTTYRVVKDIDNNIYPVVVIGEQEWMAENLKTTRYRDGTEIPNVVEDGAWKNLTSGAFTFYNNDTYYIGIYGRLYNWYAATDIHELCPAGWHVPSEADWQTLINTLGSEAGKKMKEEGTLHWNTPNEGTNQSGFTALPGGWRTGAGTWLTNGQPSVGNYAGFWSSTGSNQSVRTAYDVSLSYYETLVSEGYHNKTIGNSIRCIKD